MINSKNSAEVQLHPAIIAQIKSIIDKKFRVFLFGSRARNTNLKYSDIDLCLRGDTVIPDIEMGNFKEHFQQSNIPYMVDLVDYHAISQGFREQIEKDWVEL